MIANYNNPASTQGLRNRIAELERQVATLQAELVEARTNSADGRANSALLKQFEDYKEHIRRCVADFDAGVQRLHAEHVAECAKRGIEL